MSAVRCIKIISGLCQMEKTAHMIQSYLGYPLCKGGLAAICVSTDVWAGVEKIFL